MKHETTENNHNHLSQELLIPRACSCDTSRLVLASNQASQLLPLTTAEPPKYFSGYEKQVGEISDNYLIIPNGSTIINVNDRFVLYKLDEVYKIAEVPIYKYAMENYSNKVTSYIDNLEMGVLEDDFLLFKTAVYDENLNLQYGVNLNTMMISSNYTFEDAIILFESSAEKLKYTKFNEISININKNEMLLPIYGENKFFPNVGEKVEDGILCIKRIIDSNNIHNLFKNTIYEKKDGDKVTLAKGIIKHIEIFVNNEKFNEEYSSVNQLIDLHKKFMDDTWFKDRDFELKHKNYNYDDESILKIKSNIRRFSDDDWEYNKNKFNNFVLKFIVEEEYPVEHGSKLSGRYGNKGVVSAILPDHLQPVTDSGEKVEIIYNLLGVVGRLIPPVLYEIETNFISRKTINHYRYLYDTGEYEAFISSILATLSYICSDRYIDHIKSNVVDYKEFADDIIVNGFNVHQPPMFGCCDFDDLVKIYQDHDFLELENVNLLGRDTITKFVVGASYVTCLKHQPIGKTSARSVAKLSPTGIATKSDNVKDNTALVSDSAIKVGEQELMLMLGIKDQTDNVIDFLSTHASDKSKRLKLLKQMLNGGYEGEDDDTIDFTSNGYNKKLTNALLKTAIKLENPVDDIDEISNLMKI